MHIALLGGSGYVGSCFRTQLENRGHRTSLISRSDCNLFGTDQLRKRLSDIAPDYVINSAGYTGKPNVDACELDRANCLAGNALLPGIIGKACQDLDIPWGHVSSGCIFTGRRDDGNGFQEADAPNFSFRQNNCSFYSGTKALGEEILQDFPRCHIWRLRIPFSNIASRRNYLSKVITYNQLLDAENSLSNLDEFVAAATDCMERKLPFGIYNLTNPGSLSTRQIVQLIRDCGVSNKKFKFFESEEEFMRIAAVAPRSNCVLDSAKALAAGLQLSPIEDSVRSALKHWITEERKVECEL